MSYRMSGKRCTRRWLAYNASNSHLRMPTSLLSPPARRPVFRLPDSLRMRFGVLARTVAAVVGGYLLAALTAALMSLHLPMARVDAVMTGTMTALVVFPAAVMWSFAARTALRAWIGLAVPVGLLALPFALSGGAA